MTEYSSQDQIDSVTQQLIESAGVKEVYGVSVSRRPMMVLDMDGDITVGYQLAGDAYPLGKNDDPEKQNLPLDLNIEEALAQGRIEAGLFGAKSLDVRLPKNLVDLLNEANDLGGDHKFDMVILTSREGEDLKTILKASGVRDTENLLMVADSGAVLYAQGQTEKLYQPTTEEEAVFSDIISMREALEHVTDEVLSANGYDPKGRPKLYLEEKAIARNVHFRDALEHYGLDESARDALEEKLSEAIYSKLSSALEKHFPSLEDRPFTMIHGPDTVEIKLTNVDKGKALEMLLLRAQSEHYSPSAIVFAGDDICKNALTEPAEGTDYPAFVKAAEWQKDPDFGRPVFTVHTHHPANADLARPDHPHPEKDAQAMGVSPDLTFPTPLQTADFISEVVKKTRDKTQNATLEFAQPTESRQR